VAEVRYYTDEHVSRAIIRGLRNRGIDVLAAQEAMMFSASDDAHLSLARRENRVLFTQDADFLRIAATGVAHAGVVYAHQRTSIGHIIRGLVLIHQVLDAEEMVGQIEFI
jgi:uncharacterized protein with PIN domain